MEQVRNAAEIKRNNSEELRLEAELKRNDDFSLSVDNCNDAAQKAEKVFNDFMASETLRAQNENIRMTSENNRNLQENSRVIDEGERVNNETERKNAELLREDSESLRKEKETLRIQSETLRSIAENVRMPSAQIRIGNEEKRNQEYFDSVESCLDVTQRAEDVIGSILTAFDALPCSIEISGEGSSPIVQLLFVKQ